MVAQRAGFRAIIERKPFTRDFLVAVLDAVVLPALGVKRRPARKG